MKNILPLIVILLSALWSACDSSSSGDRGLVEDKPKFTTSDASEIFFKNVRSLYYDKIVMDEAKLDVYRIKDRVEAEDEPMLNLSIVVNWRYDEAYVLTEPNAYLRQLDTIRVMWQDTIRDDAGIYEFSQGNKERHFRFATQLYRSIGAEHKLHLLKEGEKIDFLHSGDAREAFRKTMYDYYRLVDLL